MNDTLDPSSATEEASAGPKIGAGGMIRQAREAAGLHVGALSVMLKVPVQRLEALEAERWELLPDPVFVRALAGNVCRAVKIDSTEVLARLPRPNPQCIEGPAKLDASFRGDGAIRTTSLSSHFSRPVLIAVGALLLGSLVLALLPLIQARWTSKQGGEEPKVEVAPPVPLPDKAPEVVDSAARNVASDTGARLVPGPGASEASVGFPTTASPVPAVPAVEPAVLSPSAGATDSIVVFKAKGSSWIQVTDAGGAVVLKKELAAGETAGVSGSLPLSIVVGRADVTTVEVRGKPLDLTAVARSNVARFEVKE